MRLNQVRVTVLLLLISVVARAQVFVKAERAEENGQGILRPRSGECFLLAPKHVVTSNTEVSIVTDARRAAKARVEMEYDEDLALLRVDPSTPIPCSEAWDAAARLKDRLESLTEGVLENRLEDGSLQRRFVRVVSHDAIRIMIRATAPQDKLFQGLSGSLLRLGGTPAGMLIQVNATSGDGIVLRADHMSDLIRSFFEVQVEEKAVEAQGFTIDPMDASYIVSERTSLYEKPDQLAATASVLEVGAVVRVTGRVRERLWFRVRTTDGAVGFVQTRVVQKF